MAVLRAATSAVRGRLAQVFAQRLLVDGFIPLGCGSGLECPRSKELEQRLGRSGGAAPAVWVTAVVHLSLGLLWSWQLGKGTASERHHLLRLLATLPPLAILVADAGYVGYDVLAALLAAGQAFLLRLSSTAP